MKIERRHSEARTVLPDGRTLVLTTEVACYLQNDECCYQRVVSRTIAGVTEAEADEVLAFLCDPNRPRPSCFYTPDA